MAFADFSIQAYCTQLLSCVISGDVPPVHANKIREYIDAHISRHNATYNQDDRHLFDELGAKLWNATTKYMRADQTQTTPGLPPLLRALSFLLLDTGQPKASPSASPKKALGIAVRILSTAIKAARSLLDAGFDHELCSQILSRAAHADAIFDELKQKASTIADDDFATAENARFDFLLLRTLSDHKRGHEGLAAMHIAASTQRLEAVATPAPAMVEKYADLTFEIGRALRKKNEQDNALEWLEKCCRALERIEEGVDPGLDELRTSAHHELVRALLGRGARADLDRAESVIDYMMMERQPTLAACVLKLDALAMRQLFPIHDFHRTIKTAMISVVLTDSTFKIIMHYIHKLSKHDSQLACQTLDSLTQLRLLEYGNLEWLEKTMINRLWLCSTNAQNMGQLEIMTQIFDEVYIGLGESFTADATYAAQALIWKCIETEASADRHKEAICWCRFALHSLFASSGEQSKSKLARKLANIALAYKDYAEARAALTAMPDSGRHELLTLYVAYKIGLREGDDDLATRSLDEVASDGGQTAMDILYACVLEAQQSGSRAHAITCLQTILYRLDKNGPGEKEQLPIVIRCTVRILVTELDGAEPVESARILNEIVQIMRVAGHNLSQYKGNDELIWMAKTSYNLALKYITVLDTTTVTEGLLDTCIMFTNRLVELTNTGEVTYRLCMCHFLYTAVLVVQARATDDVEHAKAIYGSVRQHVRHCQDALSNCTDDEKKSLSFQSAAAIRFDLEAIIALGAWEDLNAALDIAMRTITNETADLDTLADLVIVIHEQMIRASIDKTYHEKLPNVLQHIVNHSWRRDRSNMLKVARWIRCVFRMTLSVNTAMAMQCLEQAAAIAARVTSTARPGEQYPQTELEWLASTAFNHAVDLFCASEQQLEYRRWAEAALNLAKTAVLDKEFYEHMQRSFIRLTQAQQERDGS